MPTTVPMPMLHQPKAAVFNANEAIQRPGWFTLAMCAVEIGRPSARNAVVVPPREQEHPGRLRHLARLGARRGSGWRGQDAHLADVAPDHGHAARPDEGEQNDSDELHVSLHVKVDVPAL